MDRTTIVTPPVTGPSGGASEDWLLITMAGNHVGQIFALSRRKLLAIVGRDDEADVRVLDPGISRRHASIRYDPADDKFLLSDLESRNGTFVDGERLTGERALMVGDKVRFGAETVMRVSLASDTEATFARKMYQAILRDSLTGAYNRRYFDDRLVTEVAYALRHKSALSVLLLDIDHFKRINDEHGHQAGDLVLQAFVKLLESKVRTEDVIARYGGEEFAVICRDTDAERAVVLAERLRRAVETMMVAPNNERIPVTMSLGIADIRGVDPQTPESLVAGADRALYAAKAAGRNGWRVG